MWWMETIIKERLEKQNAGWSRRKSLCFWFVGIQVRISHMWFHIYIYIYIFLPFSYFLMVCFNVKGDTVGSLAADTEREVSWGLRCLLGINCCESKREGGYWAEGKFRA